MNSQSAWGIHVFTIYDPDLTSWNEVAGIYIFCGVSPQNYWMPLYIGQADSFRTRIPGHEQWTPAQRLGAIRIHAMVVALAENRDRIERELIRAYQPALNVHHKATFGALVR
jgi:excinuclease UvrABC nuclease subunit